MTISEEALHELTALAGVVLAQEDLSSTLDEICRISVRAIPNAEGASLTMFNEQGPAAVAASDDWAKTLDETQYREREGPCLDAARTGLVFRVRDLKEESRWPSYAPHAAGLGARSMISLPLTVEGKLLGALNLYARDSDAFDAESVSVAEIIAGHAGLASQVAATFFRHRDLSEGLQQAMLSRATIEQAKGILMARHKVRAEPAFELLRAASSRRNVKLRVLAEEVVETGKLAES
ncbi:MAG TPA: GAF and ANTAR domain-containing protein [Sporichthya sp.]|nr:GAF and ANTAR domain-containing protein [Sporichthya sp.]